MPESANATLLCLVPKVHNPDCVKLFRSISLCNTIYKIVTKLLVSRIRPFRNELISPLQTSFMPGRSGSDNVILVQEVIHHLKYKKSRSGHIGIKLDLEKACDCLKWDFIRKMLHNFNFPQLWIHLIMSCLSNSSMSIIHNDSTTKSFHPSRGIRQGETLSPFSLHSMPETRLSSGNSPPTNSREVGFLPLPRFPPYTTLYRLEMDLDHQNSPSETNSPFGLLRKVNLKTKDALCPMGVPIDNHCKICPQVAKSNVHMLRDCPHAWTVWQLLKVPNRLWQTFNQLYPTWLFANCGSQLQHDQGFPLAINGRLSL
ncbi:hypothetical protein Acr_15g0002820 [Actinidia rufa]|uniref:Reverse transcriptase domain-containing protein n=1 Tax=Actinidia rufa TaxID=165716 RepID=A0A7J0FSL4_9ERIC|nr:hypothetical protein Acr_15g0002820 [Actinidia rufa]